MKTKAPIRGFLCVTIDMCLTKISNRLCRTEQGIKLHSVVVRGAVVGKWMVKMNRITRRSDTM